MGLHSRVAKKKVMNNNKLVSAVTTAAAVEVVALFALGYATGVNVPGVTLAAATTIFVDGSKDVLPTNASQADDRMRGTLNGAYDQCGAGSTGYCAGNVYVPYSSPTQYRGDFGILTGGVGYDQSTAAATTNTLQAIRDAQHDPSYHPGDPIYVVGYSQGSAAQADTLRQIEANNALHPDPNDPMHIDTSHLTFVLSGNPARNDGGAFAGLGPGVYVPFLGLSFGRSTDPSTDPNAPQVIMITKQYDGASDVPKYVLTNPIAAANTALGFYYVHLGTGYYDDVTFDPKTLDRNLDGKVDQSEVDYANAHSNGDYVVTRNNNVVDVVITNKPGQLPITQPLRALGVPDSVILAIDPLLRAIIDSSYQRPTDGVYPATPVHFGLVPGPAKTAGDVLSIAAALKQTENNLDGLNGLNLAPQSLQPLDAGKQKDPVADKTIEPVVTRDVDVTPDPPTSPTEPTPPVTVQKVEEPKGEPLTFKPRGTVFTGTTAKPPSLPGTNTFGTGVNNVATAVNQVGTAVNNLVTGTLTAVQNALTPKKPTAAAPAATASPAG